MFVRTFWKKLSKKFNLDWYVTRMTCTLREDFWIFVIISLQIFLRMRNISWKICLENHVSCAIMSPPPLHEHGAINEIMWENMLEADRARYVSRIRRMCSAWWISKASDTHSEYVILTPVHKTTHRLLRTSATTPSAEHHMEQHNTYTT